MKKRGKEYGGLCANLVGSVLQHLDDEELRRLKKMRGERLDMMSETAEYVLRARIEQEGRVTGVGMFHSGVVKVEDFETRAWMDRGILVESVPGCCILAATTDFTELDGARRWGGPFMGKTELMGWGYSCGEIPQLQGRREMAGHKSTCYMRCIDIPRGCGEEKMVVQCMQKKAGGPADRFVGLKQMAFETDELRLLCRCGTKDAAVRCDDLASGWDAAVYEGKTIRIGV
jgi:hypothetical protein